MGLIEPEDQTFPISGLEQWINRKQGTLLGAMETKQRNSCQKYTSMENIIHIMLQRNLNGENCKNGNSRTCNIVSNKALTDICSLMPPIVKIRNKQSGTNRFGLLSIPLYLKPISALQQSIPGTECVHIERDICTYAHL